PTAMSVDVCNPFAAQLEHLPALRAGRHFEMRLAFKRRHIDLPAQSRQRKSNRNLAIEVIVFALKDFMLLDMDDDIKVARRCATDTGFAIVRGTQPRAFPDSSRDFQFDAAEFFHASLPMALWTRLLDDFTGTATAGTGLRNVKKSSRTDHLTTAAAGRTVNRTRPRLSPAAMTLVTGIELLDFNLFFDPESRFFEADLHVVTQIRSALAIFSAPACASKECLENSAAESTSAKDFAENVERIMETTETSATRGKGSVTEAVVGGALIRIHKDIISFPTLLEFFLR